MESPYSKDIEKQMKRHFQSLPENLRRGYAAIEAIKLGWGGKTYICNLLGINYQTLIHGISDLQKPPLLGRKRVIGAGRKKKIDTIKNIDEVFLKVIEEHTAGNPMNETIRWTNLTRKEVAERMEKRGIKISVTVVKQLLKKHQFVKRKAQKKRHSKTLSIVKNNFSVSMNLNSNILKREIQ